jgi:hypothetical protein
MGRRGGRGLDPDTAIEIKLDANARRHSREDTPRDEAVADLRRIAGGRTDLLAVAAGSVLGGYLGAPTTSHPQDVYAAGLLILAGADPARIVAHVDDVRRAVEAPRYGTT